MRTACDCLWGLLLYVLCTGMFAFTGLTAAQVESMREVKACPPPPPPPHPHNRPLVSSTYLLHYGRGGVCIELKMPTLARVGCGGGR